MFHFLPPPLHAIVPFVIVLGVLVFIHELGHYWAARWMGVHVEAFSIGFGQPVARWRDRIGTEWRLGWLPLGGYVKLHGQERPEDTTPEQRAAWIPGRTFHEKSVARRAVVIAAGPVANFLLAIVLYAALFSTTGQPVMLPVVGNVQAGSAAEHAGLLAGDRVTTIDGAPVTTFEEVRDAVASHPETQLMFGVRRGEQALQVPVVPALRQQGGTRVGLLGITSQETEFHRLPIGRSIVAGADTTWEVSRQTLLAVWQMLSGQRGAGDLGGPLQIADLAGKAAESGLASLTELIALLSVNLGLFNLFPIPVLDGGHLLFYAFEAVRGRPLPPRVIEYGFRTGLALLAALFTFTTWNYAGSSGARAWVAHLIGAL